jgi:hypothetical protein
MSVRSIVRWRHWRRVRWAVLAAAVPALWACNARDLEAPQYMPQRVENNLFQETVNRDVDMLVMIDDSQSMQPLISKLQRNFPTLTDYLKTLPGGLPNIHLAVVSQDLGAGTENRIQGCAVGGNGGEFFDAPTPGCPAAAVGFTLPAGQHFISVINGVPNYAPATLDISDVFSCIANLGDQGCGFEHQIQSVVRALGADPNFPLPDKNAGFLRQDAYLVILMLTNEDDCSAPPDSGLFTANEQHVTDPLGQLASYRCNEFGHLCGTPPTPPPHDTATGDLSPCHSSEGMSPQGLGQLLKVSDMIANIKSVKSDPTQILVSVIAGLPTPYIVDLMAPNIAGDPMAPVVRHSCVTPATNPPEYADPGVRLNDFVTAFGGNGLFEQICADSFVPALQQIGALISRALRPKCITGAVQNDANGNPLCTVTSHSFDAMGTETDTLLPFCGDPNTANACTPGSTTNSANCTSCWSLGQDAMNCPGSQVLQVGRPAGPPPSNVNDTISCSVCLPPAAGQAPPPGC